MTTVRDGGAHPRAATAAPLSAVFVIDDIATLQPGHDTSVALMEAAQLRGHQVRITTANLLDAENGAAYATCWQVTLRPAVRHDDKWVTDTDWYTLGPAHRYRLGDADAVFMRTDPPVDATYLRATYLLDLVDPARTQVINAPAGLRNANEHLFTLRCPDIGPESIVTADRGRIRRTVREWGRGVLKPVEGMAGRGILVLDPADPNLPSIVDTATERGRVQVLVQRWIPECAEGDRRVIVLDGTPIGAVRRVAGEGEFRCNMAAGARPVRDEVRPVDRRICARLAPLLRANGLVFVGIDVIGDRLTEVNVTSPTGLREIDLLSGTALGHDILGWVETHSSAQNAATRTP